MLRKKFRVSVPMVLVFLLLASVFAFTVKEGFTESKEKDKRSSNQQPAQSKTV
jgi:hypothetical protein